MIDVNLNGAFLVANGAYRMMREPDAAGRAHHQQRLDHAHTPRGRLGTVHGVQARDHRPDQDDRAGRPAAEIACGQIDIGNAATPMTARMAKGVPQADGALKPEPTMDVEKSGARSSTWPACSRTQTRCS